MKLPLKRLHLIEFEDFRWLPSVLRDGATAHLHMLAKTGRMSTTFLQPVERIISNTGETHILDLCSGAGGPLPQLIRQLDNKNVHATLTDLYPNHGQLGTLAAENSAFTYSAQPVDATDVDISGFRTLFNSFHHFRPDMARKIIGDAVDKRQAIGIFEIVERSPGALLSVVFATLGVFFLMPFIRPRKLSWLVLTYLIPLIPLLVLWDGVASCFRVYSPRELEAIIDSVPGNDRYHWEIYQERLPYLVAKATILTGFPEKTIPDSPGEKANTVQRP